jgi:hypothetical protein
MKGLERSTGGDDDGGGGGVDCRAGDSSVEYSRGTVNDK